MLTSDERRRADPRSNLSADELWLASLRAVPQVARPQRRGDAIGLAAGILGALALGAFTLVSLSQQRTAEAPAIVAAETPPAQEPERFIAPAPPEDLAELQMEAAPAPSASDVLPMVIDNSADTATSVAASAEGAASPEAGESFTLRTGADAAPARAQPSGNLSTTIVQGTIIPAVLETALNSEMPGFARAIVSRDVRSFDGAAVLVPRGSRLIGLYRAGSAPGQSRAFIVWSRLIRPDGVSIQLASPALDMTGAVGVPGNVDRHFFQNFGSSLLLSVVGALPAIAGAGSPTVVIGTGAAAQTAASQAMQSDARVAPTIRIPIGTPIQVFTARDLSFE
jgi:type IV secretion system protein VirB10